ncbi:hypothetical protein CHS0354_022349 [Potamilus streckersoni]|uniref:Uncharacterized protein n=1 Tax=Potamilus streckersoni TaxID=2493646 RepID=A0AAE0T3D1_9BIVA|nr:hypothetical protein CHS0354_022349 [Potamilus streckersoni]
MQNHLSSKPSRGQHRPIDRHTYKDQHADRYDYKQSYGENDRNYRPNGQNQCSFTNGVMYPLRHSTEKEGIIGIQNGFSRTFSQSTDPTNDISLDLLDFSFNRADHAKQPSKNPGCRNIPRHPSKSNPRSKNKNYKQNDPYKRKSSNDAPLDRKIRHCKFERKSSTQGDNNFLQDNHMRLQDDIPPELPPRIYVAKMPPHLQKNDDNKKSTNGFTRSNSDGIKDTSKHTTKKVLVEKFSNAESVNSKTHLLYPKRRSRACLVTSMIATIVLVIVGVAAAVITIFLWQKDSSTNPDNIDMIRAHIRLRILNRDFHEDMLVNSTAAYNSISVPLCEKVDEVFLQGLFRETYYGCQSHALENGSIRVYFTSNFLDIPLIKNESFLKQAILAKKSSQKSYHVPTSMLGDFVIDADSMTVVFEEYKVSTLPHKPNIKGLNSTASSSTTLDAHKLESTSERNAPSSASSTSHGEAKTQTTLTTDAVSFDIDQPEQTTTTESATTGFTVPEISVTSTEIELLTKANIRCSVKPLPSFRNITIYHIDYARFHRLIIDIGYKGVALVDMIVSDNVKIDMQYRKDILTVNLKFSRASCQNEGEYVFTVYSPGFEISATGQLKVRAIPQKPQLSLPIEVVEDREIKHPITCTANVGYPPGRLQWFIKPKGTADFIPFEGKILSTSGTCSNFITSSLLYIPTREGNGTLLKCQVINTKVPSLQDLSDVGEIKVLPGDTCKTVPVKTTRRHPFTCTKYILCLEDTFNVYQCPNELCFDEETGKCGQTALTMTSTVAFLKEGVTSIRCRLLHLGEWSHITIWKIRPNGNKTKVLTVDRKVGTAIYETFMKDRIFADIVSTRYEVEVNLLIYVLTCEDEGWYRCTADVPFELPEAEGEIIVKVKPEAPIISAPVDVIENHPTQGLFSCKANVGHPQGNLVWKVKYKNETEFKVLPYSQTVREEVFNCSQIVERSFTILPSMEQNGMELKCEVDNPNTLPAGHTLVSMETIYVIPGNFCAGNNDNKLVAHPHDCRKYVHCIEGTRMYVQKCSQGLCFNQTTGRCDTPESTETVVDPDHPCRPNRNGVFFPHPFICNKYIWCVQGEEVVQHCPMGTLYISNGQCTFDMQQSRCYNIGGA